MIDRNYILEAIKNWNDLGKWCHSLVGAEVTSTQDDEAYYSMLDGMSDAELNEYYEWLHGD